MVYQRNPIIEGLDIIYRGRNGFGMIRIINVPALPEV